MVFIRRLVIVIEQFSRFDFRLDSIESSTIERLELEFENFFFDGEVIKMCSCSSLDEKNIGKYLNI